MPARNIPLAHNPKYTTDLAFLAKMAVEKEEENEHFRLFLKHEDGAKVDAAAHRIYEEVNAGVDCTVCGNCCKTLVVNITNDEIKDLSEFLETPEPQVREKYIEESLAGNCFINSIPCHFLDGTKCSIYTHRFTECRDFPHLHKPGFSERFLGTLLHYGSCPIIYNVVEEVKRELEFIQEA